MTSLHVSNLTKVLGFPTVEVPAEIGLLGWTEDGGVLVKEAFEFAKTEGSGAGATGEELVVVAFEKDLDGGGFLDGDDGYRWSVPSYLKVTGRTY
jgi:hypothetical protein